MVLFLLLVFIPVAHALFPAYYQEANAGFLFEGGVSYTGYGFNLPNAEPNASTYSMCTLPAGLYSPLAYDFDGDLINEFLIVVNEREIEIYDLSCSLLAEYVWGTGVRIQTMPVLENTDGDADIDILILTNITVERLEYDSGGFIAQRQANVLEGKSFGSDSARFTCNRFELDDNWCFIYAQGSFNVTIVDFNDGTAQPTLTEVEGEFTDAISTPIVAETYTGTAMTQTSNGVDTALLCTVFSALGLRCYFIDNDGDAGVTFDPTAIGGDYIDMSAFIGKVDNVYRAGVSWYMDATPTKGHYKLYDLSGNQIVYSSDSATTPMASNWVFADYDKDGDTDACILIKTALSCFDANGNLLMNLTIANLTASQRGISMADFDPNEDYLGIATYEGVFYPNSTFFSTGLTGATKGHTVISMIGLDTFIPVYAYIDDGEGFIVSAGNVTATCGDGICQDYENGFSCAVDCGAEIPPDANVTGDSCSSSADCSLGTCEYGFCALGNTNAPCDADGDCISGDCNNGKCTRAEIVDQLENAIEQQYGSSTATFNFVSLFLLIGIAIMILWGTGGNPVGIWASVGWLFMGAIFFTIIGWLSLFILLGMVFVGLIIIVFAFMIGSGSN